MILRPALHGQLERIELFDILCIRTFETGLGISRSLLHPQHSSVFLRKKAAFPNTSLSRIKMESAQHIRGRILF